MEPSSTLPAMGDVASTSAIGLEMQAAVDKRQRVPMSERRAGVTVSTARRQSNTACKLTLRWISIY